MTLKLTLYLASVTAAMKPAGPAPTTRTSTATSSRRSEWTVMVETSNSKGASILVEEVKSGSVLCGMCADAESQNTVVLKSIGRPVILQYRKKGQSTIFQSVLFGVSEVRIDPCELLSLTEIRIAEINAEGRPL